MAEKVCDCLAEYKARRKQRNGKKRHYTIKDLMRVSGYVMRDEKPTRVIAAIMVSTGMDNIFNDATLKIEALMTIAAFIKTSSVIAAAERGFYLLINAWLIRDIAKFIPIPFIKLIIAAVIALIALGKNIMSKAKELMSDQIALELFWNFYKDVNTECENIRKEQNLPPLIKPLPNDFVEDDNSLLSDAISYLEGFFSDKIYSEQIVYESNTELNPILPTQIDSIAQTIKNYVDAKING